MKFYPVFPFSSFEVYTVQFLLRDLHVKFYPVFPFSSFEVVDTEKLKELDLSEFFDEFFF